MYKIPILDDIGFFGPFILIFYAIIMLTCRLPYIIIYTLFMLVSSGLNRCLKRTIRQPRPSKTGIMYSEFESVTGTEQYGMPSGHSQSVAFSTAFIYLVTKSIYSLIGCSFVSCITFYQRYKYKRHSISQIIMGALTGIGVASLAYYFIFRYLSYS